MPASPEQQVATALMDARAMELRRDGNSYRAIAEQLDVSVATAHASVQRALKTIRKENAETVRALELQRLDDSLMVALDIRDNPLTRDDIRLQAIATIVRLQERRSKLEGLDAPTKIEHRITDSVDAAIEQLAAELGAFELPADVNAEA